MIFFLNEITCLHINPVNLLIKESHLAAGINHSSWRKSPSLALWHIQQVFDEYLLAYDDLKEGADKVKYIRENDIKNPIIIVPNSLKKSLIICPKGNLLVEDELKNARDWINSGGSALMLDVGPYKECPTIYSIEEAFIYAKEHGFI